MKVLKCILLIIFSAITIEESVGQDVALKPKDVRVYFQSVTYSNPQQNIPSTVVIYDTYYHKIDSISIPKEGLYLKLPKIDLIFKVRANEVGYRPKGEVFYVEELIDSIKIVIYSKETSGGHISIRPIFFSQNSYVLDSTALDNLKHIRKVLLLCDDSTHCFNVEIHSNIDVLERKDSVELLTNRARVVKEVLKQNNAMDIVVFITNNQYPPIEKPKTKEEHAYNRCVTFKLGRVNCPNKELIMKIDSEK